MLIKKRMVRKQERCLGYENMVAEIYSVGILKISQYIKKNDTMENVIAIC